MMWCIHQTVFKELIIAELVHVLACGRYVFGLTHIPRLEDWPVMPVEHIGFMLMVLFSSYTYAHDFADVICLFMAV